MGFLDPIFARKVAEDPSNTVLPLETLVVTDRSVIESLVCCFSDNSRIALKSENTVIFLIFFSLALLICIFLTLD